MGASSRETGLKQREIKRWRLRESTLESVNNERKLNYSQRFNHSSLKDSGSNIHL